MAQEQPIDSLTSADRSQPAEGEDTTAIKREIERTRSEMSDTIGEIQERLRPDHLLQQAKDGVREAATGKVKDMMQTAGETASVAAEQARGVGSRVAWYAQEHPLYVALAVGALTWLALRRRGSETDWYGATDTSWDRSDYTSDDYTSTEPSLRDRVGDYASTARETVGGIASTARETVGEYATTAAESARIAASRARSAASTASMQAQRSWETASTSVDDFVTTSPLAAGAVAIAVGVAIGMSAPSTEMEDRTMGQTRDQALERAKTVANNLRENVTNKVQSVAENVVGDSLLGKPAGQDSTMGRV